MAGASSPQAVQEASRLLISSPPDPPQKIPPSPANTPPAALAPPCGSNHPGAILYGTARELLSSITARGIHGPIMLPTVDARCFLPETKANPGG